MRRITSLLVLASAAVGLCVAKAEATSPASPEQILCLANYIFVGKATKATPVRSQTETASRRGTRVDLSIAVHRIIGALEQAGPVLGPGDTLTAITYAEVAPSPPSFGHYGGLKFQGPFNSVIPDAALTKAYTGEAFIYYTRRSSSPDVRWQVAQWPLEKEGWVRETMARYAEIGQPCASPL